MAMNISRFLSLILLLASFGGLKLSAALADPTTDVGDSAILTDVPLRTKNRAKPNVLFLVDNGQTTQKTYSLDGLSSALTNLTNISSARTQTVFKFKRSSTAVAYNQVSNDVSYGDTDWHYRASGSYAGGGTCATRITGRQVCTLGDTTGNCPITNCQDAFNRLYYDPTVTYSVPVDSAGAALPLPVGQYNNDSQARGQGCVCTDLTKCAWVDGFAAQQANYRFANDDGCVDLTKNFSAVAYPSLGTMLMPWSTLGAYPVKPRAPLFGGVINTDGTVALLPSNPMPPGVGADPNNIATTATIYGPSDTGNPYSGQFGYSAGSANNATLSCYISGTTPGASSPVANNPPGAPLCPSSIQTAGTFGSASNYYPSDCRVSSSANTCSCPSGWSSASGGRCSKTGQTTTSCTTLPGARLVLTVNNLQCPLGTVSGPNHWSSPYYCDVASQSPNSNFAWNVCQNTARGTIYANPGPADFFDPDGTRHVITNTSDSHFGTAANITNFATWHSFYRTRLLSLKSSLNLSMNSAQLSANFRVGLATLANGSDGTQTTLGAAASSDNHFFSSVAEFSDALPNHFPGHKTEWYGQLAKIQPNANMLFSDYPGTLHKIYLWFAGNIADPAVPRGYLSQYDANRTANSGAQSQYLTVKNSSQQVVTLNRPGPLMYSCQANGLVFLASSPYSGLNTSPNLPNLGGTAGACTDSTGSYDGAATPCELSSAGAVTLPSYLTSFNDTYPRGTASPVTIRSSDSSWPAPFRASANNYYSGVYNATEGLINPQQSMADLALYYWAHDLNEEYNRFNAGQIPVAVPRPDGSGKMGVPPFGDDVATWPHVTTYLVSLALRGQYDYSLSATLTGFKTGINSWPRPSVVPSGTTSVIIDNVDSEGNLTGGTSTITVYGQTYTSVDDMAHAAMNGHGKLLASRDSSTLGSALGSTFSDILQLAGSESAVAVANTQVSQTGTSYAFQSSYNTASWWGDLVASKIQPTTGVIQAYTFNSTTCASNSNTDPGWSALCQLRNTLCPNYLAGTCAIIPGSNQATTRVIVTDKGDATAAPDQGMQFTDGSFSTSQLNQFKSTGHNDAANVIAYLRGDSTNEYCANGDSGSYRCRKKNGTTISYWNPLGDIVDAEAVVIGPPLSNYLDAGYRSTTTTNGDGTTTTSTGFYEAQQNRAPVVFQAANDGMLHAFHVGNGTNGDSTRGTESWAYIPSFVHPNLKQLASQSYSHQYYVNATPAFADVDFSSGLVGTGWRTILVGGLGKGGKGYYALNVTTPSVSGNSFGDKVADAASKILWTFPNSASRCPNSSGHGTHDPADDIGYTYGRPAIVKAGGQWVVLVTSGYGNRGDGKGHLYVLKAADGSCLKDLVTTGTGLAYIAAQVVEPGQDQSLVAVYGGDQTGKVWKFAAPTFDTNTRTWSNWPAPTLFATLKDGANRVQAVTSEPNLAVIDGTPVIYVGTGQYLGTNDVPPTSEFKADPNYVGQSIYALPDDSTKWDYTATSARNPTTTGADTPTTAVIAGDCTNSSGDLVTTGCAFSSSFCTVASPLTRCFSPSLQTSLSGTTSPHPWVFDLPAGERVITSPLIVLGALMFTSNQPVADPCQPGGRSFFYMLNYRTGGAVSGAGYISQAIYDPVTEYNVMASRPTIIQLPDGRVIGLVSTSVGATLQIQNVLSQPARRVSWREVPNQ